MYVPEGQLIQINPEWCVLSRRGLRRQSTQTFVGLQAIFLHRIDSSKILVDELRVIITNQQPLDETLLHVNDFFQRLDLDRRISSRWSAWSCLSCIRTRRCQGLLRIGNIPHFRWPNNITE